MAFRLAQSVLQSEHRDLVGRSVTVGIQSDR
jgi:hypothetical protein